MDDAHCDRGGFGGGGGIFVRCGLQTDRMFFGTDVCCTTKIGVFRWMMHIVTGGFSGGWGGGGVFSFVVDCKQTGCSSVQMCVVTNCNQS